VVSTGMRDDMYHCKKGNERCFRAGDYIKCPVYVHYSRIMATGERLQPGSSALGWWFRSLAGTVLQFQWTC
jgi:hypothetical protein